MSNQPRDVEYDDKAAKPGSDARNGGTPVMKGKPEQPAQSEKGDARRRDPRINKNSQAQQDDQRDGMVQQGRERNRDASDTDRHTRDQQGEEALRNMHAGGDPQRH